MEGVVKILFFYWHEGEQAERIESMWTSPYGAYYKIENIPFYTIGFALGDIVSAKDKDGTLFVDDLVEASGHSTVRIIFFDKTIVAQTRAELRVWGCDSEGSNRYFYVAIDVPPKINYKEVIKPYLEKGFTEERWDYEEACLADNHR